MQTDGAETTFAAGGTGRARRPRRAPEPSRHALVTPLAWTAAHDLEHRDWLVEGRRIGVMWRGSPWWIGDWLLFGTRRWGEHYAEAARITRYDPKTLRNLRYVSSRFEVSRRRDDLTWSHHALVAGLDAESQQHWLDRATEGRIPVAELRAELRAAAQGGYAVAREVAPAPPAPPLQSVVCPQCGHNVPVNGEPGS